ncbi:MAG: hypothetical protein LAT83_14515 [Kiritimatiellae bacterium]|nr:hypothetical protein [Kiritimatiellia bacterium]
MNSPTSPKPFQRTVMILAALSLGSISTAADQTWQNIGSDWGTGANWGGSIPGATGTGSNTSDLATFPSSGSIVQPNLDGNFSIGALDIDNTEGNYNLTQTGGTRSLRINRKTVGGMDNTYFRMTGGGTTQIDPNVEIARGGGGEQSFVFNLGSGTLNFQGETLFSRTVLDNHDK